MSRRQAFTLVEVIAGVLLFSMGMMAIVGVIIFGLRSAARAQSEATAWATAYSVLKDPKPMLGSTDRATGSLQLWAWSRSGDTWTAADESGQPAWSWTTWSVGTAKDVLVPDMRDPIANNPAVFPSAAAPITGCARGWINGYYVERREQSRASDRISDLTRIVEVRVDVYWASIGSSADGRPLASLVDRIVRQDMP